MAPTTKLPIISVVVVVLLFLTPALCQETDHEKEFSYDEDSEIGPPHWGNIHEDWVACGEGEEQSPINIDSDRDVTDDDDGQLQLYYGPGHATMVNRGHDIMIRWDEDAGGIVVGETEYKLKQLHWHSPSEHTIDGVKLAMELHLVHESEDKKIAVVGLLYELGPEDRLIQEMTQNIEAVRDAEQNTEEELGVLHLWDLVDWGIPQFYRYMGSLTTPPCTENVVWSIIKEVRTVSEEQVNLLQEAVHDEHRMNARPVQPINNRDVKLYDSNSWIGAAAV